jgi:hypothetical protein
MQHFSHSLGIIKIESTNQHDAIKMEKAFDAFDRQNHKKTRAMAFVRLSNGLAAFLILARTPIHMQENPEHLSFVSPEGHRYHGEFESVLHRFTWFRIEQDGSRTPVDTLPDEVRYESKHFDAEPKRVPRRSTNASSAHSNHMGWVDTLLEPKTFFLLMVCAILVSILIVEYQSGQTLTRDLHQCHTDRIHDRQAATVLRNHASHIQNILRAPSFAAHFTTLMYEMQQLNQTALL